jgi:hypothetical protein
LDDPNAKDIKPIFGQRACFIKANHIELASNVDSARISLASRGQGNYGFKRIPLRANTKYLLFLES